MSRLSLKTSLPLMLLIAVAHISVRGDDADGSDYNFPPQWCIADEQTPDDVLQGALNWACGEGGADCTQIQENQPCYLPNTMKDHASYAFNSYYQKFKHQGADCYFNAAAVISEHNPSYNGCQFEYLP